MAADVPHPESVRYGGHLFAFPFLCIITHTMACISTVEARESFSAAVTENDGAGVDSDTDVPPGGRLVRVPIDELQKAATK